MSFWSRLFGRKPTELPVIDRRWLGDTDWHRGDLAVCIRDDFDTPHPSAPAVGDLLCVARVTEINSRLGIGLFLGFESKPDRVRFEAFAFRKIRPEHTAAEDEFTALIKRGRKVRA